MRRVLVAVLGLLVWSGCSTTAVETSCSGDCSPAAGTVASVVSSPPSSAVSTSTTTEVVATRVLVLGDSLVALGRQVYEQGLLAAGFDVVGFYALSGASIDDVYHSPEWTLPRPGQLPAVDVVYLSFGTNDVHERKGRSDDQINDDLQRLLGEFDQPGTCVVWQTWMSDLSHLEGIPEGYEERLSNWWITVAQEADVVNDLGPLLEGDPSLLSIDGIHLSEAGTAQNKDRMISAVTECDS